MHPRLRPPESCPASTGGRGVKEQRRSRARRSRQQQQQKCRADRIAPLGACTSSRRKAEWRSNAYGGNRRFLGSLGTRQLHHRARTLEHRPEHSGAPWAVLLGRCSWRVMFLYGDMKCCSLHEHPPARSLAVSEIEGSKCFGHETRVRTTSFWHETMEVGSFWRTRHDATSCDAGEDFGFGGHAPQG